MSAHEVKPVRLIQSLCAVCGSNLAGLTLLYIVLSCVADVSIVNCAVCQQFIKQTLLLLFFYARYSVPKDLEITNIIIIIIIIISIIKLQWMNTNHNLPRQFHLLNVSLQQRGQRVVHSDLLLLSHHQDH